MSRKERCLVVGAGAEASFGLPTGNQFTWETCYTKNRKLYQALADFYRGRLNSERLPNNYENQFLYRATNQQFKLLISGMLPDHMDLKSDGASALNQLLGKQWHLDEALYQQAKDSSLSAEQYKHLFSELIASTEDDSAQQNLIDFAREKMPPDSYFGTIESYFSSLIDPIHRSGQFWKLINYYWTAFFAVATPLIEACYSDNPAFKTEGLYGFTLNSLNEVVAEISKPETPIESPGFSYYEQLKHEFDAVITTNYTGLCEALAPDTLPIHISGALWEFESPESLSVRDIRDKPVDDNEFVFPYLLTQAPIKPIIGWNEADDLRRMLNVLDRTVNLCVLGYSFCPSDAHIASIIGSWLKDDSRRQLHYFYHETPVTSEDVCHLLRIGTDCLNRIHIHKASDIGAIAKGL